MNDTNDFSPSRLAALVQADVGRALAEDVGAGDLTAALVDPSPTAHREAETAKAHRG